MRTVDDNLCITVLSERSRREWSTAVTQSAAKSSEAVNQTSRHFRLDCLPSPPLRSSTSMQDIRVCTEGRIRFLPGFYMDDTRMGSAADRCLACNVLGRLANPSSGTASVDTRYINIATTESPRGDTHQIEGSRRAERLSSATNSHSLVRCCCQRRPAGLQWPLCVFHSILSQQNSSLSHSSQTWWQPIRPATTRIP